MVPSALEQIASDLDGWLIFAGFTAEQARRLKFVKWAYRSGRITS